ncbi:MAG TPA: hypothetical protein VJX95_03410 [Oscillospiraceae bacterium]|nr:hypothetical protein [Oscillospiraceae bacterium]
MDKFLFEQACERAIGLKRGQNGIGTLGEKSLHAILKYYFEPYEQSHETKIGGFVADIVGENGIIEIQTRAFDKLRRKLDAFLEVARVTVVYPIPSTKWLIWIDEETGEATTRRKSPKKGKPYAIFPELYKIKQQLAHPNLRICITMLDIEEYRYLNGWSKDKKKGSSRCDRIPVGIVEELYIEGAYDYAALIPSTLPQSFTTKDFAKHAGISQPLSQVTLNIMNYMGAVKRNGKQGNAFLYEKGV